MAGVMKIRDTVTGGWLPISTAGAAGAQGPQGPRGPTGPAGEKGDTGTSSVIIGSFGAITTPADLPVDGLLVADWDGPGNPAAAYQMETGYSLVYLKPSDPLDGHLFQYVTTAVDPTGWIDIGRTQGPPGPEGPLGPTGPMGDDLFVGPDDPATTKPTTELWYDTDDNRILGPAQFPLGGADGNALVKNTSDDGDAVWTGGEGQSVVIGDNAGFTMAGGGGMFKSSGGGWNLRRHNDNRNIMVTNNDGAAGTEIILANGTVPYTGTARWGNNEGDKIYLYPGSSPGTNSFGHGIAASTLVSFVPDNAMFKWRDGGGHDGGSEYMVLDNTNLTLHGRQVATRPDTEVEVPVTGGTVRSGQNYIYYNDSIVCWYVSLTPSSLWEGSWKLFVNASAYPSFLRPARTIERWKAAPNGTHNATSIAVGIQIEANGNVSCWKPADGPNIETTTVINFDFVYPRNY